MFTDLGKKPLLTNWLPWQQEIVYFLFLKLKILLIPSYEESPNLVAIGPKLKKLSTGKQNLRGKHLLPPPPPRANRVKVLTVLKNKDALKHSFV